jgi:hypothetical protein
MDAGFEDDFAEAIICRGTNGTQGIYMRVYKDGSYNGSYSSWTSTHNYGYIRIFLDRSNNRWRAYDYINGTWQYRELSNASSYPIGDSFYVRIHTNDHGAGNDTDIDNFTFNANEDDVVFHDWVTPQLQNIYLQKSIEIPDIYPNTAKDAYMKLEVPTADMSWAGSYSTNLKAWWEVPT